MRRSRLIYPLDGGAPITRDEWERRTERLKAEKAWLRVVDGITRQARARAGARRDSHRAFYESERFG